MRPVALCAAALIAGGALAQQNYELTDRQIIAYLPTLEAGAQLQLVYRLRATMPITGR